VVLAPLALASAVLNTTITSLVSKAVFREEIGGTLGLLGALESLTGIVAPPIGGALLEKAGAWAPGVFAALVMAGVVAYILRQVVPIVDDAVAQCRFSPPTARSR
jgi:fucose permease